MKKYKLIPVVVLWAGLTAAAWFGPKQSFSDAERRPLAQRPEISGKTVLNRTFMGDFEKYTLDQFPLRDSFRELKSRFHLDVMNVRDNNGIYFEGGHAVKQEYPLNEKSLDHALERFQYLYDQYLTGCKVYAAIVPDKGYYLAEQSGHLSMDYDKLYAKVEQGMPWATHLDLRPWLTHHSYYRTDTHWRQEEIAEMAAWMAETMGAEPFREFTPVTAERPFRGVYYGQAARPMEADSLTMLEGKLLEACTVYDHETGKTLPVYDQEKLGGKDMYEVFLSGPKSLLTIRNPGGTPGKELIVFRDSFGSSLAPLLVKDYETVTLIDIRYLQSSILGHFVEFHDQDVLFLYSTLVLNNSNTMK